MLRILVLGVLPRQNSMAKWDKAITQLVSGVGVGYGKQETGSGTYSYAMYRMQAEKLYYQQEPAKHPGKAGAQEILSFWQETHGS